MLRARDNPFRMQRLEALRYRLDEAGWEQLLARFTANRWRGVLVGPQGSGKTTLREEIEARLRADGWSVRVWVLTDVGAITWPGLRTWVDGADDRTLLSLDGLDRVSALTWWRLCRATRSVGGILATSHVAGRLPTLHHHRTSVALLRELVHELVIDGDEHARIDRGCDDLFARHRGDVRACLRSLYDAVGDRPGDCGPRRLRR